MGLYNNGYIIYKSTMDSMAMLVITRGYLSISGLKHMNIEMIMG